MLDSGVLMRGARAAPAPCGHRERNTDPAQEAGKCMQSRRPRTRDWKVEAKERHRPPSDQKPDEMGNAVPGMPDMRLGEIKDLVETMFTTFTPLYALGFGEALIAQEKAKRSGGGHTIPYRLLTMPPASEPLVSGFIMKRVRQSRPRERASGLLVCSDHASAPPRLWAPLEPGHGCADRGLRGYTILPACRCPPLCPGLGAWCQRLPCHTLRLLLAGQGRAPGAPACPFPSRGCINS